jgi:dTDP-4-amino-4,6-dideoxygalactose transaminase
MDGFQGAVLGVKLLHLDAWNERRRRIAAAYDRAFAGLPGVTILPPRPRANPTYHVYPLFHAQRDAFRAALERHGVQTGVHYPRPVHLQPAYAHLDVGAGSLPCSEKAASTELSLPMFAELTDEQVNAVVLAVEKVARELG